MVKLILFLKKSYLFILFAAIELVALHCYSNSTGYTRARMLTLSNKLVGGAYSGVSGVSDYFHLRRQNRELTEEVTRLRNELAAYQQAPAEEVVKLPVEELNPYVFTSARVVRNSINREDNMFTINKGLRDGVMENMAVLAPSGAMVGYVVSCSDKFSVCMSVLNRGFRASGRFKGSDYFGNLVWNTHDPRTVTLSEIPKYAAIEVGDTIVTTGFSFMFPPGIPVGEVVDYRVSENPALYDVTVRLAADMNTVGNVVLVNYTDANEALDLESSATGR
ncbi:MAG: rod shape-determining protein MreC [Rikenellaceae bacterium]|nr:rod shape-determining protein MreC [Rikenellaceae bacterium]